MEPLKESMTLDELKLFMKKQGYEIVMDKMKDRNYLIRFTVSGIRSFIYYSQIASDLDVVVFTDLCFEAFFNDKGVITSEDINNINCQPIIGRLSIQPTGSMAYALFVSLIGGVTERHLEHQFKTWLKYTLKCKDFISASEDGVKQLKLQLSTIFGNYDRRG